MTLFNYKKSILLLLIAVALTFMYMCERAPEPLHAQDVPVDRLFMISDDTNALYTVDRNTGVATRVGNATNFGVNETTPTGLAWDGTALFMVGTNRAALFTLDLDTGVATRVNSNVEEFGRGLSSPTSLVWDGNNLRMNDGSTGRMHVLNRSNGRGTSQSSSFSFIRFNDMTWDGTRVLMVTGTNQGFIHLVASNGTTSVLSTQAGFGVGESIPNGLAWDGTTVFMVGDVRGDLFALNTTTWQATSRGDLGVLRPRDLAFVPASDLNAIPTVNITTPPTNVNRGQTIALSATASDDDAGDTLTYSWGHANVPTAATFGIFSSTSTLNTTWTAPNDSFEANIPANLRLTVTDNKGASAIATLVITVRAHTISNLTTSPTIQDSDQQIIINATTLNHGGVPYTLHWRYQDLAGSCCALAGSTDVTGATGNVTIVGLDGNTNYRFQGAFNNQFTIGEQTVDGSTHQSPSVTSHNAINVTDVFARLTATLGNPDNVTMSNLVVRYRPTEPDNEPFVNLITGSFSGTNIATSISDLEADTEYEYEIVRVVGTNETVITIGTFTTLSVDATLSALSINPGTIVPTFSPDTLHYTTTVRHIVDQITIVPVTNHNGATIEYLDVDSNTISDADSSITGQQIDLNVGSNTILVRVTAENGVVQQSYQLMVTRFADASLASLSVSSGTLAPPFNSDTLTYSVTVDNNVASVMFTVVATAADATISGDLTCPLGVGDNTCTITVVPSDMNGQTDYTITVQRQSNIAILSDLSVMPGALSPSFIGDNGMYDVIVSNDIDTVIVTANAVVDSNVTVTTTFSNGTVTGDLSNGFTVSGLAQGYRANDIEIQVVSEDGSAIKKYTIRVTRQVLVSFGSPSYGTGEGMVGNSAAVVLRLSADAGNVIIPITTTNQGGASDADYSSNVPDNVTFDAGDTEKTFTFTVIDDVIDDDDESVRFRIGTLTGNALERVEIGSPNETIVNIMDDDNPHVVVRFEQSSDNVGEGDEKSIIVLLDKDPERTIIIPITALGQNMAMDNDYNVPDEVIFNRREIRQTIIFRATDDNIDDDGERVILGFGTPPERVTIGTPDTNTVTINDDDDPPVTVTFDKSTYTAAESGSVLVTVTLSADPERTVIIPIVDTPQGTTSSGDYSGVPDNVTFNSGERTMTFTFMTASDDDDDDGESVELSFGTLPFRVSGGNIIMSVINITDDDDPTIVVSFGQSSYNVEEGDRQVITIILDVDPERTVRIGLDSENQGGSDLDDMIVIDPRQIEFTAGGPLTQTFTITIEDDDIDNDGEREVVIGFDSETTETVRAITSVEIGDLLSPGIRLGSQQRATINIIDNDIAGIRISTSELEPGLTIIEQGPAGTYTVVLDTKPTADVTVTVTGHIRTDLTLMPAILTFATNTWDEKQRVTVMAGDDDDAEDDIVTLTHTAASMDGVYNNIMANVVVTVFDNDIGGPTGFQQLKLIKEVIGSPICPDCFSVKRDSRASGYEFVIEYDWVHIERLLGLVSVHHTGSSVLIHEIATDTMITALIATNIVNSGPITIPPPIRCAGNFGPWPILPGGGDRPIIQPGPPAQIIQCETSVTVTGAFVRSFVDSDEGRKRSANSYTLESKLDASRILWTESNIKPSHRAVTVSIGGTSVLQRRDRSYVVYTDGNINIALMRPMFETIIRATTTIHRDGILPQTVDGDSITLSDTDLPLDTSATITFGLLRNFPELGSKLDRTTTYSIIVRRVGPTTPLTPHPIPGFLTQSIVLILTDGNEFVAGEDGKGTIVVGVEDPITFKHDSSDPSAEVSIMGYHYSIQRLESDELVLGPPCPPNTWKIMTIDSLPYTDSVYCPDPTSHGVFSLPATVMGDNQITIVVEHQTLRAGGAINPIDLRGGAGAGGTNPVTGMNESQKAAPDIVGYHSRGSLRNTICAAPEMFLGDKACGPLMIFVPPLVSIVVLFSIFGVRHPIALSGIGMVVMIGMSAIIMPAPIMIGGFIVASIGIGAWLILLRR